MTAANLLTCVPGAGSNAFDSAVLSCVLNAIRPETLQLSFGPLHRDFRLLNDAVATGGSRLVVVKAVTDTLFPCLPSRLVRLGASRHSRLARLRCASSSVSPISRIDRVSQTGCIEGDLKSFEIEINPKMLKPPQCISWSSRMISLDSIKSSVVW